MKSLKRPMFRKGGNVGTGIMTGIVDRSMHAQDPFVGMVRPERTQSSFIEEVQEGIGPYGGMDPITSYLLAAGPQIAESTSFANLIGNLKGSNEMLMKQAAEKAKFNRGIRMEGVKRKLDYDALRDEDILDYSKLIEGRGREDELINRKQGLEESNIRLRADLQSGLLTQEEEANAKAALLKNKNELAQIKEKGQIQKDVTQMNIDANKATEAANDPFSEQNQAIEYFKLYGTEYEAKNRANFEKNLKVPMMKKFGSNFGGLVGGTTTYSDGSIEAKMKKKGNIGKAFYDVNDGKIKKIDYELDKNGKKVLGIIIIDDITTYNPSDKKDSVAAAKTKKEKSQKEIDDRFRYFPPDTRKKIDDYMESVRQKDEEFPV